MNTALSKMKAVAVVMGILALVPFLSGCLKDEGRVRAVFESDHWRVTFCITVKHAPVYGIDDIYDLRLTAYPRVKDPLREEIREEAHLGCAFPEPLHLNSGKESIAPFSSWGRSWQGLYQVGISRLEECLRQGEVVVTWTEDGEERREVLQLVEYHKNPIGVFRCGGI